MMRRQKKYLALSVSCILAAFSGCSVSTQDQGLGELENTPVSGVAIDGYIARGVVFADVNGNNKLDVWEKRALTDSKGYFTYNPIDKINYCQLPETDAKSIHCLHAPAGYDEVIIRITKGYDLTTVEPFTGTLSIKLNITSMNLETPAIASPLNALLSEMSDEEKQIFLGLESAISEVLLNSDYLDFSEGNNLQNADAERNAIIKLALNTHKVADIVAAELDQNFATANESSGDFFGGEEGLPADASVYIYKAMVDEIIDRDASSAPTSLSEILSNELKLKGIVQRAFELMSEYIATYNDSQTNDSDRYLIPDTILVDEIVSTIFLYINLSNTLFEDNLDSTDLAGDVNARMRAVSIVASLMRDKDSSAAQRAIDAALDTVTADNNKTYMQNMRSPKIDVARIKEKFISGTYVVNDSNFDAREGFNSLLTKNDSGLTGDNSEGFSGNQLALGSSAEDAVSIAFDGASDGATSGTMIIDANFAEGNFEGSNELEGTWEQLDEYTMLMNVEVAGVIEAVIIKPTINDEGQTVYNFDLGGEQQTWTP